MILGFKPIPYQRIVNPIKAKDRFPGAWFEEWNEKLFFIDFGDIKTHRVPIVFVMDYYKIGYIDALKLINTHFKLGLGENSNMVVPKKVLTPDQLRPSVEKQRAQIIYKPRPFTQSDSKDWSKFGIHKQHLIDDEVYAATWYKVYSAKLNRWVTIRPKDRVYVFAEFGSRVKVYRPNDIKHKFITNCTENDIFNYKNLPPEKIEVLVVEKSYKDCRVVRNMGCTSIGTQNEGSIPSKEIITDLVSRCQRIVFFYDNDLTGIRESQKLAEIFNGYYPNIAEAIWLPEHLKQDKGITDAAEMYWKLGDKELDIFLRQHRLYGNT